MAGQSVDFRELLKCSCHLDDIGGRGASARLCTCKVYGLARTTVYFPIYGVACDNYAGIVSSMPEGAMIAARQLLFAAEFLFNVFTSISMFQRGLITPWLP